MNKQDVLPKLVIGDVITIHANMNCWSAKPDGSWSAISVAEQSKCVVEEAHQDADFYSMGHYRHGGWLVTVRTLNEDGTYNPQGKLYSFYQTGDYAPFFLYPNIPVDKKMKKVFVDV